MLKNDKARDYDYIIRLSSGLTEGVAVEYVTFKILPIMLSQWEFLVRVVTFAVNLQSTIFANWRMRGEPWKSTIDSVVCLNDARAFLNCALISFSVLSAVPFWAFWIPNSECIPWSYPFLSEKGWLNRSLLNFNSIAMVATASCMHSWHMYSVSSALPLRSIPWLRSFELQKEHTFELL